MSGIVEEEIASIPSRFIMNGEVWKSYAIRRVTSFVTNYFSDKIARLPLERIVYWRKTLFHFVLSILWFRILHLACCT